MIPNVAEYFRCCLPYITRYFPLGVNVKAISQYISAMILLLIAIIGMGIVASYSIHVKNSMEKLMISSCNIYDITYISYSNGYIYLYNSGQEELVLKTPVDALIGSTWTKTNVVPRSTIFKIRSDSPKAFLLLKDGCILVIKP